MTIKNLLRPNTKEIDPSSSRAINGAFDTVSSFFGVVVG